MSGCLTREQYLEAKGILIHYLYLRIKQEDWHGVWDVAIDLARLDERYDESQKR